MTLIVLISFFILTGKTESTETTEAKVTKETQQYQVSFTQSAAVAEGGIGFKIVGYAALDPQVMPQSFLAVYENSGKTSAEIYRYAPAVPEEVGYPSPLQLEKIWLNNPENGELKIVSSWGETGANYFGTHPVVTTYKDGKFQATDFYEGNMAEKEEIKGFSWTQKDFSISNYFDENEKVKTIQTQGIEVTDGNVELSFFGDDNCHACEHNTVKLQFPL